MSLVNNIGLQLGKLANGINAVKNYPDTVVNQVNDEQLKSYRQNFANMNEQHVQQLNQLFTTANLTPKEREVIFADLTQKEKKDVVIERLKIDDEIYNSLMYSGNQKIINTFGKRY